jgi:hypothetical protein
MGATFTVQLTISRKGDATDVKGSWGPRTFSIQLAVNVDQELEVPLPALSSGIVQLIPSTGPGGPQLVLIRTDTPGVTYQRNAETTVNTLGSGPVPTPPPQGCGPPSMSYGSCPPPSTAPGGWDAVVGAPLSGVNPLTQLIFANPNATAAKVYILVAGS